MFRNKGFEGQKQRRCSMFRNKGFVGIVIAVAVIIGSLVGTACAPGAAPTAEKEWPDVWKYGFIGSMTGDSAIYGEGQSNAHILAAEQMTASGEFPFAIEVIVGDHGGDDPTLSMSAARRLVDIEGVPLIASSWNVCTKLINPICYENKVVELNAVGQDVDLINLPWCHNTRLQIQQTAPYTTKWVIDEYQPERVAMLWWNFSGTIGMADYAKAACDSEGVEVVFAEAYEPMTTDFRSTLAKIKASNPDIIFNWAYGWDHGYFISQAREAGIYPDIPVVFNEVMPYTYDTAGEDLDGVIYGMVNWYPELDTEMNKQFMATYLPRFGLTAGELDSAYPMEYEEAWGVIRTVLHHVIDNGGDPFDGEQLEMAIREIKVFPGLFEGEKIELLPGGYVIKPLSILQAGPTYEEFVEIGRIDNPVPWE